MNKKYTDRQINGLTGRQTDYLYFMVLMYTLHVIEFHTDLATVAKEDFSTKKSYGNKKKLKVKKMVVQDDIHGLPSIQCLMSTKPRQLYFQLLSQWVLFNAAWLEGLPYGTDDFGD